MWQGAMTALRQLAQGFIQDRSLGREIVYRRATGVSYDAASQMFTPTYSDTAIRAIAGQLTNKPKGEAPGSMGKTFRIFTLIQGDLTGEPKPGDLITLDSSSYRVGTVRKDSAGARYRIEAELL